MSVSLLKAEVWTIRWLLRTEIFAESMALLCKPREFFELKNKKGSTILQNKNYLSKIIWMSLSLFKMDGVRSTQIEIQIDDIFSTRLFQSCTPRNTTQLRLFTTNTKKSYNMNQFNALPWVYLCVCTQKMKLKVWTYFISFIAICVKRFTIITMHPVGNLKASSNFTISFNWCDKIENCYYSCIIYTFSMDFNAFISHSVFFISQYSSVLFVFSASFFLHLSMRIQNLHFPL